MKKLILSSIIALSFFSINANANNEVKKCTGKLHACFTNNFDLLVDMNPSNALECNIACNNPDLANLGGGCDVDQCVSRCEVAFLGAQSCQ